MSELFRTVWLSDLVDLIDKPETNRIVCHGKEFALVKPGHWIMKPNGYGTCSNCKACSLDIMGGVHSSFCPNCGAKMDEVIE